MSSLFLKMSMVRLVSLVSHSGSSLIEGDEGCTAKVVKTTPQNHAPPEWQHSIQAAAANGNVNITAFLLLHHA